MKDWQFRPDKPDSLHGNIYANGEPDAEPVITTLNRTEAQLVLALRDSHVVLLNLFRYLAGQTISLNGPLATLLGDAATAIDNAAKLTGEGQ